MGDLLFCRVPHLGFFLSILLALSLCYGNHVTVNVEGFIECAQCIPVGVRSSEASSGTGLLFNIECKSRGGDLKRLGAGEVDGTGNFKIEFLQDKNIEDQAERGSCFLRLEAASGAPCPGEEVQNVLVMISKSIDNVKQTPAMTRKLKFSSITFTSTIQWPSDQNNEELIDIPFSPSRPNHEKPLRPVPPPMPHLYEPLPRMAQAPEIRQSFPSLAPYIKEPPPQQTPHSQRLVPSTAPAPMVETPHFPPLAPTYENLIPVRAPTPPPTNSPGPILQKPNPPPVPTFKKSAPQPHPSVPVQQPNAPLHPPSSPNPTTPAPSHSAKPVLQKPNTPPVPSPNAPVHPPISPTPMSHPSPKPADKSAPSPLPIINPTQPAKQRHKPFYPIPKAPPIPQLPPVPTVPRRYFNWPKYGSQPSSPPS